MSRNVAASKRGFGYDPVSRSLGVYVNGALTASFPPTPGRTYFVNNITGDSANSGLSWSTAFAQPDEAISASETYRELGGVEGGAADTTNDYVRNTIMVQGTATAYDGIVTLPSYCDLIGLGANPYGNGGGIARVGADSYVTASGGGMTGESNSTGDVRGLYMYNIQWQSNGSADCFQVYNIYRSTFEECAFFVAGTPNASPVAGIDLVGNAGGLVIRDCHWGGNASRATRILTGLNIAANFTMCLVDRCIIGAMTAGIFVASGTSGQGSIVRDCMIGDIGQGDCVTGIQDEASTGMIQYINNSINAADPLAISGDTSRMVGNLDHSGSYISS